MQFSQPDYKVAILVMDGFEESEMIAPRMALDQAGAQTWIISKDINVRAWSHGNWSQSYSVDMSLEAAVADDFDALLLPGGVISADALRLSDHAVQFVKGIVQAGKPIAVICHGAWILINAKAVKGKTITSWPSLRIDLENAGAKWVDQEVVVDDLLVSSRMPHDLPVFNAEMLKLFLPTL